MEYETINKETPEMKQLISGIREVSKRLREIAKRIVLYSVAKSTSRGERSVNGFSSALAHCRIIGIRGLYHIPKSQEKYSTVSPTLTDCCKKTITIINCPRSKVSYWSLKHGIFDIKNTNF